MPRIRVTQLEPPDPWERQASESRAAFEAFATYRDQERRRSLRRVAQSVGKTSSVIANWSVQHGWVARCDFWDAELDRVRREATKATVEEMAARHAAMASSLLAKVGWRVVDLKGDNLSIGQLLRALELGVRIEREARGMRSADAPTVAITQNQSQVQLSAWQSGAAIGDYVRAHPETLAIVVGALAKIEEVMGGDVSGEP
ncbi:MAG: hypothetical protein ABIP53_11320 [Candidatus Limnocylindrales bacterium]